MAFNQCEKRLMVGQYELACMLKHEHPGMCLISMGATEEAFLTLAKQIPSEQIPDEVKQFIRIANAK